MPSQESPTQRPVTRRVDRSAADTGTLAAMGVVPVPPVPSIRPFLEPSFPPPEPDWPEDPS